jgi:transposase
VYNNGDSGDISKGGVIMAYFLKQAKLKGRTYLSIVESYYNHNKKGTAHRTYKSLSSVETHKANGMDDPVAVFQKEVDDLNNERDSSHTRMITNISPLIHLGYFPLKSIMEKLNIKKYVDYFKLTTSFEFDLFELLSSLIYARSVNPCSKRRTFHEVLPSLYETCEYSYDQLLDGLSFLGINYRKFVEIFTVSTQSIYGLDTSKTYFDCTNFYFEIDREDDFRRKGPSKENRRDPIVGLGLLLDNNQIPIGMEMFPGNESEMPVIREVIRSLKDRNNITGRTIHVADKGLNCAENIATTKKSGDGYLFSKSVKGLPAIEREWVLLHNSDYKEVHDSSGKVLYYYKSCVDEFPYSVEHEGRKVTVKLKEKRLVTYNPELAAKKRYEINKMVDKAKTLTISQAKKSDFGETGKYVSFTDKQGGKAQTSINQQAIDKDLTLAGYNLIVTSELKMKDEDIYATYHNLWRIEESFRIMKSDLDARPAFVQKESTIKGHFLICYLTVLLQRLFQFNVLEDMFPATQIFDFFKDFKATRADGKYINTTMDSQFIAHLAKKLDLPLRNYYLSETQIKKIMNFKLTSGKALKNPLRE